MADIKEKRMYETGLRMLQDRFPSFDSFLDYGMKKMGFSVSEIQHSIAIFLEYGGSNIMVQAQRQQAKSTITVLFAIYRLIRKPSEKILICSAGEKVANQMTTMIFNCIMRWEILEVLRPRQSDRRSTTGFDVNHSIKGIDGVDKTPSVSCCGINSMMEGLRTTLLIMDDIESSNGADKILNQAELKERSQSMTQLVEPTGRIVYLGTPQSIDSVYNGLASRGYTVRIWPGRYPTPEQRPTYGEHLAEFIANKLDENPELGTGGGLYANQGQPTDDRLGEAFQRKVEHDVETPKYQLQQMLNTTLSDKNRFPLKAENLIVMRINPDNLPMTVNRDPRESTLKSYAVNTVPIKLSVAMGIADAFSKPTSTIAVIDPAGGGKVSADETAYWIMSFLNGNVFVLDMGAVPGGFETKDLTVMAEDIAKWKPDTVLIEKNFGNGAFAKIFQPVLKVATDKIKAHQIGITEFNSSGQKELRIINSLEAPLARGNIILSDHLIERDNMLISKYGASAKLSYSFFYQLTRITREKKCLVHDDRLDAFAMGIAHYVKQMSVNQELVSKKTKEAEFRKWLKNPMGYTHGEFARQQRPKNYLDQQTRR